MDTLAFSASSRNTALAALAGVATAALVKLLLDEAAGTTPPMHQPATQAFDKYQQMQEAMRDPAYLADMQAVADDFAFADTELLRASGVGKSAGLC